MKPHLPPGLFLNRSGHVDQISGSTCSVFSVMPSDSESSSSRSSSGMMASPQPVLSDETKVSERLEAILVQLQQATQERDELRKSMSLTSSAVAFDDCGQDIALGATLCSDRPNPGPDQDYEKLKAEYEQTTASLLSLQVQETKTLKRCEEAEQEGDFYRVLHSRLLSEQSQMREEVEGIKRENAKLVREHGQLKQTWDQLKRQHAHDREELKELADLRLQQEQEEVMRGNGSSEILKKVYNSAMKKLESVKEEYDILSTLHNERMSSHSADLSKLKQVEEENRQLQEQVDAAMRQRDAALHYQQTYSSSPRRLDAVQQELDKAVAQASKLQRERDQLRAKVTHSRTLRMKAAKDMDRYKEERDCMMREYRTVMSERDQVIREVDRLQAALEAAEAKLRNGSTESTDGMEALRQELNSLLMDRDGAMCERNDLLDKYCQEAQSKTEAQAELAQAYRHIKATQKERDEARKEKTEVIVQADLLLLAYYQTIQNQEWGAVDVERARAEINVLRGQCEIMFLELREALQEVEVAKLHRDQAYQVRDKTVAERESMRTLSNTLWREKDRAVNGLIAVLHDLDKMRESKHEALQNLREMKERVENHVESEPWYGPLTDSLYSQDSAMYTVSLEREAELEWFGKDRVGFDLKALGFDVAELGNDSCRPGNCGIFVTRVDRGSVADGKLRVNDWVLRLNGLDLTSGNWRQVVGTVLNGGGAVSAVVCRKKPASQKHVDPAPLNLEGSEGCGFSLESGIFVAAVTQGSPAAQEGSLTVGDRLIAINGFVLDNKPLADCEALLRNCSASLCLSIMKVI